MLKVTIPDNELFDEGKGEFIHLKKQTLQLEHSLVSLSKWESRWNKPFFSKKKKTIEESIDYIKCMTITQNVDENVYKTLTSDILNIVSSYIQANMTATVFSNEKKTINREIITAEIIYYWMISFNIPFDPCQKWHIDRLITLINVCNIKNQPSKKMTNREIMTRNAELNASRKRALNTKG